MAPRKENPLQVRQNQAKQLEEAIKAIEASIADLQKKSTVVALLDSVSQGLYEEIDKLARKAPAEPLTELAVGQANDLIRETKELLSDDTFVQRLNEFVPAGDNPQHRDAVVVLRQIRQGLERSQKQFSALHMLWHSRLREAEAAVIAVELFLQGRQEVSKDDLKANGVQVEDDWLVGSGFNKSFSFLRLDRTNIPEYFGQAK